MAFFTPQDLPTPGGKSAQGHALVNFYAAADHRGLADDHTGAVVDEEGRANLRTGMNVNAGVAVGDFCQQAGQYRCAQTVEGIGDPMHRDGIVAGVGGDDLCLRGGGGVAAEESMQILLQQRTDSGNVFQQSEANPLAFIPLVRQ